MNKVRIALLTLTFVSAFIYQPMWVYENFWSKADFYDSIPFDVPYFVFLLIYASIATAVAELVIRFIKKFA